MDYIDEIRQSTSLDKLFSLWKSKEPKDGINHQKNAFISDGIVDPVTWSDQSQKTILFVLKEAYDRYGTGYSLNEWLHKYLVKKIWKRVAKVSHGIQNTNATTISEYKAELSDDEYRSSLNRIAVMNLKKSGGRSHSDHNEILRYAEYDSEELKKEFELIDADIIVCGYTFTILYEVIFGNDPIKKCDNWYYWLRYNGRDRLFIDYYHPGFYTSDLLYYYGLIAIYQQAIINRPESDAINQLEKPFRVTS